MVDIDLGVPHTRGQRVGQPQETNDGRATTMTEAGSVGETLCGAGAVALTILGLLGVLPLTLAAIASIALGVGLLIGGAALTRRYQAGVPAGAMPRAREEVVGALGFQAIAGVAAIALGVLALLGLDQLTLLAISVLVLGAALLVAGGGVARLAQSSRLLRGEPGEVYSATGYGEAILGVGAVVLGILALTGHVPLTLTLVALLSVGAAILVGGSLLTARLFNLFG